MDIQQEAVGAVPMEAEELAAELRGLGFTDAKAASPADMTEQDMALRAEEVTQAVSEVLDGTTDVSVTLSRLEEHLQQRSRLPPLRSLRVPGGPVMHWHHLYEDVPEGPSLVIAQVRADVVPLSPHASPLGISPRGRSSSTRCRCTSSSTRRRGGWSASWTWRRVRVAAHVPSTAASADGRPLVCAASDPHHLRYVLSPHATPATSTLVLGRKSDMAVAAESLQRQAAALAKRAHMTAGGAAAATEEEEPTAKGKGDGTPDPADVRVGPAPFEAAETTRLGDETVGDRVEVSARSLVTMQEVAMRVARHGGGALVVDYGHGHASADSLRGIRKHQFTHPLEAPGHSDLVRAARASKGCHSRDGWLCRRRPMLTFTHCARQR